MAEAWPVGLQQKLNADGFQVKFGNTNLRSDMDVGPAKVRSRYTDAVDIYTCSILLNDMDEYDTFLTFFKTTLNNGSLRFEFDDPFSGDPTEFRFAEPPDIRPLGGTVFQVSMSWEKLP